MTRSSLLALSLLILAAPVAAQQRMGPPQSGQGLLTGITLTAAQQKRVDSAWAANQPMRDKMRAQMQSGERPDSAQRAAMRSMRERSATEMRAMLTPDQQKVFDQNLSEMRARMQDTGAGMGGGQGAAPKQ